MSLSSYAQRVRPFALLDKLLKPDLLATATAVKYICFLSFVLAGFDFMIFLTYKGPEGRAFMAAAVLEVLLSLLGIYACFTFHYRAATAYAGCLIIREAFYLLLGIVVVSMINEDPKDAHQSWKYAAAFIQFIVGLVSAYYGYIFWRRLRAQGFLPSSRFYSTFFRFLLSFSFSSCLVKLPHFRMLSLNKPNRASTESWTRL
ncbi:hypothetical protein QOT17_016560 [Balamuthia mandrillaris]